jgi:hypothetical protein
MTHSWLDPLSALASRGSVSAIKAVRRFGEPAASDNTIRPGQLTAAKGRISRKCRSLKGL